MSSEPTGERSGDVTGVLQMAGVPRWVSSIQVAAALAASSDSAAQPSARANKAAASSPGQLADHKGRSSD